MCVDPRISKPATLPPLAEGRRDECRARPEPGLYAADYEHDACGVAFVARLDATPLHETVRRALEALENLEHRGAAGADPSTGDGAGILMQIPDAFFRARRRRRAARRRGATASRCASCPATPERRQELEARLEAIVADEGQDVVCWRDVPVDPAYVGRTAGASAPVVRQLVVAAGGDVAADQDAFERKLYVIRRRFELEGGADAIVPSFSSRTIVYKGMLTAPQLRGYYPDLQDERTESALALVHSRFSTNTFPSWELAHPYRMIAHNGEINTVRGNINWMRARESQLASELFGDDLRKVLPVVQEGGSDSATLDNVLELLVLGGRSLPHAMMMMIPEATAGRADLPPELLGFYAYHQCLMEAWDGPAAVVVHGRPRDRLDPRPQRPAARTLARDARRLGRARLRDGRARHPAPRTSSARAGCSPASSSSSTSSRGGSSPTTRSSARSPTRQPYGEWFEREVVRLADLPPRMPHAAADRVAAPAPDRLRLLARGHEGDPRAARAERRGGGQLDGERHAARRSLRSPPAHLLVLQAAVRPGHEPADRLDPRGDRDEPRRRASARRRTSSTRRPSTRASSCCESPILLDSELEQLRQVHSAIFKARTLDMTWPVAEGPAGMDVALERLCREADEALAAGHQHPDPLRPRRRPGAGRRCRRCSRPPPSTTTSCARARASRPGSWSSPGETRSVHSVATLIGYGAAAVNPYLMLETLGELVELGWLPEGMTDRPGAGPGGQGARQGAAEDALEDGDLDDPVVLRRPDLRGRRPRARARRPPLHRHRVAHRRRRHRDLRARHARPPRPRLPGRRATRCCP